MRPVHLGVAFLCLGAALSPVRAAETRLYWGDTHLHTIAVQDLLHFLFRKKNILAIVRDQEAITIPMCRHPALDETGCIGELDATFAVRLDLTIALHGG